MQIIESSATAPEQLKKDMLAGKVIVPKNDELTYYPTNATNIGQYVRNSIRKGSWDVHCFATRKITVLFGTNQGYQTLDFAKAKETSGVKNAWYQDSKGNRLQGSKAITAFFNECKPVKK
jgi:hypothetical protein